jgi:N-acetylmuramoyl-L-alanine amidase
MEGLLNKIHNLTQGARNRISTTLFARKANTPRKTNRLTLGFMLVAAMAACLAAAHPSKTHHSAGVRSVKRGKGHHLQRTTAQVEYTYQGLSNVQAWRQQEECVAPLTMLEAWGWQVTNEPNGRVKLQVEDQSVEVALRQVEGQDCILLREAIRLLDGNSTWITPDRLQITGRVRVVRYVSHHLKVSSSLSVTPKVTQPNAQGLAHLELSGATLSQDAIVDVEPSVKVSTDAPNQLGIDFPAPGRFLVPAEAVQPTKDLDLDSSQTITVSPSDTVSLTHETEQGLTLDLGSSQHLSGPVKIARTDATTLKLSLPGVQISQSPDLSQTPSVAAVIPTTTDRGTDLILQLKRPMGVKVSQTNGRLQVVLVKPPVGDGKIAGKLIVVDAGHGGKDTGATHPYSGLHEKELTMAIAKKLAADLAAEGATVFLTRDSDEFISLEERANIANRNKADLFLCVHINSNGPDRKSSGTITFFHGQNVVSSTLADCIQRQIVQVSGIPGIGCWSDQKIYPRSGFSVLRNTKMPGVLMELGFINNDHDRAQLVREDIQDAIAAAIVKGVKTYLGTPN